MGLVWADGFDQYGSTALLQEQRYNNKFSLDQTNPRTGSGCASMNGGDCYFSFAVANHLVCGFGLYLTQLGGSIQFESTGTVYDGTSFAFNANGSITFYKGRVGEGGQAIGTTDVDIIKANAYNYIETDCDIGNQHFEARVNGVSVFETDAPFFGNTQNCGALVFRVNGQCYLDDLYLLDNNDGTTPQMLGVVRCRTLFPVSDALEGWTPHTPGSGFSEIDNVPPDTANHFLSADTVGDQSTFGMTQLPANTAYVAALVAFNYAAKSDAGVAQITPGVISNGTEGDFAAINPDVNYAYYTSVMQTDPATGLYWTKAAVNAVKMSIKRTQ